MVVKEFACLLSGLRGDNQPHLLYRGELTHVARQHQRPAWMGLNEPEKIAISFMCMGYYIVLKQ